MSGKAKIRCAIYTRKSSEEGLEQSFNSLDAQHEACSAYVTSQKHEGWVLLKERYDDGGISGGTLERPAVQRLMADIAGGKVDRVIVYKVDRLTRSLADFAKLVDRFDEAGASFVSVTQSFNTATSMGRLTLNVLLSFAQFEREVTAERIRDKIAASKKKGMWMGGNVPLGYDASDRTLIINAGEAATIRMIFDLYQEHRTIRSVKAKVDRLGLLTKRRTKASGVLHGGRPFSRGHIHFVLTNPVYAGRIRHKAIIHEGMHEPIIVPADWEAVQHLLTENAARARGKAGSAEGSVLGGKLFDETGDRMTATHSNKKGRRYRYYVSNRLLAKDDDRDAAGWRLSAERLERAVASLILDRIEAPGFAVDLLKTPAASDVQLVQSAVMRLSCKLRTDERNALISSLVQRCEVAPGHVSVELSMEAVADQTSNSNDAIDAAALTFASPLSLRRRGMETRIVISGDAVDLDEPLIRNVAKAQGWIDELRSGTSVSEIEARESVSRQRVNQILKLAFLAPDLVGDILEGRQPAGFTMDRLSRSRRLDLWSDQRVWASHLRA